MFFSILSVSFEWLFLHKKLSACFCLSDTNFMCLADPRVDYPGYVPPEISLQSYYPSRVSGVPGDYASRVPAVPADYPSRGPAVPGDYTSRGPAVPGDYTSRAPVVPAHYASGAPMLPGDYASRAPVLPSGPDILRNDVIQLNV
jgi:hypothetical protein